MIKETIKAKKAMGRPTKYCDELIDEICARLSDGESLNRILKNRSEMPAFITIYQWLRKYPDFAKKYDDARLHQAYTLADEIIAIAEKNQRRSSTIKVLCALTAAMCHGLRTAWMHASG